jgi:hypothetical protein
LCGLSDFKEGVREIRKSNCLASAKTDPGVWNDEKHLSFDGSESIRSVICGSHSAGYEELYLVGYDDI